MNKMPGTPRFLGNRCRAGWLPALALVVVIASGCTKVEDAAPAPANTAALPKLLFSYPDHPFTFSVGGYVVTSRTYTVTTYGLSHSRLVPSTARDSITFELLPSDPGVPAYDSGQYEICQDDLCRRGVIVYKSE